MELLIDGARRALIPIRVFRAAHGLPDRFGVALFEPKDFTGLGRIDTAGAALNSVRAAVLAALPPAGMPQMWQAALPALRDLFAARLREINPEVGLREVEIDFAVAGFADVCEAVLWAALSARASRRAPPSFREVYADWLDSTVRVSQTVHEYTHRGETWRVRVVHHAYGRAGLVVETAAETHYVADGALACPAEGFMTGLLGEVGEHILSGGATPPPASPGVAR
jgi:hypothetical protein